MFIPLGVIAAIPQTYLCVSTERHPDYSKETTRLKLTA